MTNSVDLVVFDIAGTTVADRGQPVHRALREALAEAGIAAEHASINAAMGIPKPMAIRQLMIEAGRDPLPGDIEAIDRSFVAKIKRHYESSPDVSSVEGAVATFRALRKRGVRVALDTGFSREVTSTVVQRLGWLGPEPEIDAAISSDEVDRGRPHPDMIFALMKRFRIADPRRVAKVGDTPSDLEQGTSAGCKFVIGVTEGSHTAAELQGCPHTHLVANVSAVPQILGIPE